MFKPSQIALVVFVLSATTVSAEATCA